MTQSAASKLALLGSRSPNLLFSDKRSGMALPVRAKKLIGAGVILLWLPIYALFAMAVGIRVLPHAGAVGQLAYYLIAGMAWIVPVGLMLPWMSREPARRQRRP